MKVRIFKMNSIRQTLPYIGERLFESAALLVSARGKLLSGADIHARSNIGKRFVLDHGYGTVIGETTEIGDDCYVLGGVVLGATGISGNSRGKRHPTIGNRVEIGAFSRVFGNVVIGDDVFVAPHCVIKENVPRNSVVSLRSELQIVRRKIASEASDKENEYLMRNMETIQ